MPNCVLDAIKYTQRRIVLKGISRVLHAMKKDIRRRTAPRIKRHIQSEIKWGLHVSRVISPVITQMNV